MKTLTLLSPAKLNLFLKVVKKRPDGYHELVTLFERISLYDTLRFKRRRDGKIKIICPHRDVPTGPKNLVYRAAQLLKSKHRLSCGATIHIMKRIPVAAGLAGGSSNAATALLGLNKLWGLELSREQLIAYGRRLGADIPFFLSGSTWALGTERGDKIKPLALKTKLWHVVVVPQFRLYTKDVFEHFAFLKAQKQLKYKPLSAVRKGKNKGGPAPTNMLTKTSDNVNILIRHLQKNDVVRAGKGLYNDLEDSAFSLSPRLKILKELFGRSNTLGVSLSGSGPSIFGLIRSQKEAESLKRALSRRYRRVFAVTTY